MADLVGLEGAAELDKLLQALPEEIARNVARQAMLAGARVVAAEMKARCPVNAEVATNQKHPPGYGRKQIRARIATNRDTGQIGQIIGGRFSIAAWAGVGSKGWYLKFPEWGWMLTGHGKGRHARQKIRHIPPKPFLRPAWESSKMKALDAIGRALGAGIEKAAARLAGPYAKSGFSKRGRTLIRL
jgi:HK97 gp10 family phage protein